LQSTHDLIADKAEPVALHLDVMREIRRLLAPFHGAGKPITGQTAICDGSTIDSLTVMDMVMELEDRFDVSVPMNAVAEIHTVDELVVTILRLRPRR